MNRRSLLLGLGAALAAPAIVKAENLMKIAAMRETITLGPNFAYIVDDAPDFTIWQWRIGYTVTRVDLTQSNLERALIEIRPHIRQSRDADLLTSRPGHLST